eukprot:6485399-Amphidinium_carterae.1
MSEQTDKALESTRRRGSERLEAAASLLSNRGAEGFARKAVSFLSESLCIQGFHSKPRLKEPRL